MSYKVLIMEDDIDLMTQWQQAFADVGVEIGKSSSRTEAESMLNKERFDALVTDIFVREQDKVVGGEGGIVLIGHVRASLLGFTPEWAETMPVVAVTASKITRVTRAWTSPKFDPLTYVEKGADLTLRKPIDPRELVRLVIELIDERRAGGVVSERPSPKNWEFD